MVGYDENFLEGITLPLPTFSPRLDGHVLRLDELENGLLANYVHYTVVTNRERRAPIIVALNIDQNLLKQTRRRDDWRIDSRISPEFQLNNDYYYNNPWDRGHLARRANAAWGQELHEAQYASDETFYFTNATLQHQNFNQDEWLALEDWVHDLNLDKDGKITSFSGPFYGDYPRTVTPAGRESATVPTAFFKVVCFINKNTNGLDVRSFIMLQDLEAIANKSGRQLFNYQNYQVTVSEIERLTGLQFQDEIYQKNPLYFHPNEAGERLNISEYPERIEVDSPEEIIAADTTRDYIEDHKVPVYITAAMVNPKGTERTNEWISVINLTAGDLDLDGWTLSDTKRGPLDIGKEPNGQKRVLGPGEAVAIRPISPLQLSNDGGVIVLYRKPKDWQTKGRRVDRVKYTRDQAKKEGEPVIFHYMDTLVENNPEDEEYNS